MSTFIENIKNSIYGIAATISRAARISHKNGVQINIPQKEYKQKRINYKACLYTIHSSNTFYGITCMQLDV